MDAIAPMDSPSETIYLNRRSRPFPGGRATAGRLFVCARARPWTFVKLIGRLAPGTEDSIKLERLVAQLDAKVIARPFARPPASWTFSLRCARRVSHTRT